jgi:hypothetical protein
MEIMGVNKSNVYMNTPFHNKYHNNQQKRRNVNALNTGQIRVRTFLMDDRDVRSD